MWGQGSTQGHWRFPAGGLEQGYTYLLTHPGTPSVFYDHLEDPHLANTIQRLIALRLRAGIHCRSKVRNPTEFAIYHGWVSDKLWQEQNLTWSPARHVLVFFCMCLLIVKDV